MRNFIGRLYHRSTVFRSIIYLPLDFLDLLDRLLGRGDDLMPPRRINATGRGNFREIGQEFLRHFIKLGDLKPSHKVLDVGCGVGRMAVALAGFLNADGQYRGFDIVPKFIQWAQKSITPRFPNFQFEHFDAYNTLYNPKSQTLARDLKFPYADGEFDFVFLTSVFTHMTPEDHEHYLSEISRVLKPGGRVLATYFLINDEALGFIKQGKSTQSFIDTGKGYWVIDEKIPEANTGYEEGAIRSMFAKYGLSIIKPIHFGLWCGRKDFLSYQDIIVASKT